MLAELLMLCEQVCGDDPSNDSKRENENTNSLLKKAHIQEDRLTESMVGEGGHEDSQKRLRDEAGVTGGDWECGGEVDETCRRSRRAKQPRIVEDGFVNIEAIEFDSIHREAWLPENVTNTKQNQYENSKASEIGFNFEVSNEELDWLPHNFNKENYIECRNHILARWRTHPTKVLSEEHALEEITAKYKGLGLAAYRFLNLNGYINFGVGKEMQLEMKNKPSSAGSVIVIGAGLAGLSTARKLRLAGFRVLVLEARSRPGGRVHSRTLRGDLVQGSAELGGSVISGVNGNPLAILCKQLCLPLKSIGPYCPLFGVDGKPVPDEVDDRIFGAFDTILDRACNWRNQKGFENVARDIRLSTAFQVARKELADVLNIDKTDEERSLIEWHIANLEFSNAAKLSDLSLGSWDQDDPYDFDGDHCLLPGGNSQLIRAMEQNLNIWYKHSVEMIDYSSGGVQVFCQNGKVVKGDAVVVTVPLGVLKKRKISFNPKLPAHKEATIDRLGFGVLNKVTMLFPSAFWMGDKSEENRGEFFMFYSYSAISGGPVLIALVAGEAGIKLEKREFSDIQNSVLGTLRKIFGRVGIQVPDPIKITYTSWQSDEWSYGSYSYMAVGSSADDYDTMAESVNDKVFFAGEATCRHHPATMHGALLSGHRAAAQVYSSLHFSEFQREQREARARAAGRKCPSGFELIPDAYSQALSISKFTSTPSETIGPVQVFLPRADVADESPVLLKIPLNKLNTRFKGLGHIFTSVNASLLPKLREHKSNSEMLYLLKDSGVRLTRRTCLGIDESSFIEEPKLANRRKKQKEGEEIAVKDGESDSDVEEEAAREFMNLPAFQRIQHLLDLAKDSNIMKNHVNASLDIKYVLDIRLDKEDSDEDSEDDENNRVRQMCHRLALLHVVNWKSLWLIMQLCVVDHVNASLETPRSWSNPAKAPAQSPTSRHDKPANQSLPSSADACIDRTPKVFECKICNIQCASEFVLQQHIAGKKHKKRMWLYE